MVALVVGEVRGGTFGRGRDARIARAARRGRRLGADDGRRAVDLAEVGKGDLFNPRLATAWYGMAEHMRAEAGGGAYREVHFLGTGGYGLMMGVECGVGGPGLVAQLTERGPPVR